MTLIQDEQVISYHGEYILSILSSNRSNLYGSYNDLIYEVKINMKLSELRNISFGYYDTRMMLEDLEDCFFKEYQLIRLCNISNTNSQVYKCIYCKDSLRRILLQNKDKIDKKLYEKTVSINYL